MLVLAVEGAWCSLESSWLGPSNLAVVGAEAAMADEELAGCALGCVESGPSMPSWRLGGMETLPWAA